jgi:hypothetical protein
MEWSPINPMASAAQGTLYPTNITWGSASIAVLPWHETPSLGHYIIIFESDYYRSYLSSP